MQDWGMFELGVEVEVFDEWLFEVLLLLEEGSLAKYCCNCWLSMYESTLFDLDSLLGMRSLDES